MTEVLTPRQSSIIEENISIDLVEETAQENRVQTQDLVNGRTLKKMDVVRASTPLSLLVYTTLALATFVILPGAPVVIALWLINGQGGLGKGPAPTLTQNPRVQDQDNEEDDDDDLPPLEDDQSTTSSRNSINSNDNDNDIEDDDDKEEEENNQSPRSSRNSISFSKKMEIIVEEEGKKEKKQIKNPKEFILKMGELQDGEIDYTELRTAADDFGKTFSKLANTTEPELNEQFLDAANELKMAVSKLVDTMKNEGKKKTSEDVTLNELLEQLQSQHIVQKEEAEPEVKTKKAQKRDQSQSAISQNDTQDQQVPTKPEFSKGIATLETATKMEQAIISSFISVNRPLPPIPNEKEFDWVEETNDKDLLDAMIKLGENSSSSNPLEKNSISAQFNQNILATSTLFDQEDIDFDKIEDKDLLSVMSGEKMIAPQGKELKKAEDRVLPNPQPEETESETQKTILLEMAKRRLNTNEDDISEDDNSEDEDFGVSTVTESQDNLKKAEEEVQEKIKIGESVIPTSRAFKKIPLPFASNEEQVKNLKPNSLLEEIKKGKELKNAKDRKLGEEIKIKKPRQLAQILDSKVGYIEKDKKDNMQGANDDEWDD